MRSQDTIFRILRRRRIGGCSLMIRWLVSLVRRIFRPSALGAMGPLLRMIMSGRRRRPVRVPICSSITGSCSPTSSSSSTPNNCTPSNPSSNSFIYNVKPNPIKTNVRTVKPANPNPSKTSPTAKVQSSTIHSMSDK
jgi:hypothetical protein